MFRKLNFVFLSFSKLTDDEKEQQKALEEYQNKSAQYSYNSSIDDNINDGMIERKEERDGSKVKGSYSYSDGFVRRSVYYEADENGYRVVKEETEEIGDGPQFNSDGQADIDSSLSGKYSIRLDKSDDKKHYTSDDTQPHSQ